MNKKTIIAGAIMMCAVMVVVAGAPLVMADTHHIVKGAQGPRASAVTWDYAPTENGFWTGHIVNSGLRSLVVDVDDAASGSSVLHQRIRFAAYPSSTLDTNPAQMMAGRTYTVTATPNGPQTTYCDVTDAFTPANPPVAVIEYTIVDATVSVDGSKSYDVDVGDSVVAWAWDFGDGATASGATATHTYAVTGDYTIMLTVEDTTGMTGSADVTVHATVTPPPNQPPTAAFTWTVNGLTVSFNAITSTDDKGVVSYAWNFGDGSTGTGVQATHTYATYGTKTVMLTVADLEGLTDSVSHDVVLTAPAQKPVAAFTPTVTGASVLVDGSASTSSPGTTITAYMWNFGDMVISTGVTHTHIYIASGTYAVTLVVVDSLGVSSDPLVKSVSATNGNPPPFPYIVYGATLGSGAAPISGCHLTITDVRTGETYIGGDPSDADGQYSIDVSVLSILTGDGLVVKATSPDGLLSGSATGTVDTSVPYVGINVTLT